ncbi:hypothetical protein TEA_022583 [Camellia sinensis var. sinensis]|uniref:Glycosyltransferase n=1 Tax=Camellia sinensis var. sinensis TaxID=542762 RepID=A0A4S4DA24_CAMSN|nr:hypothetical protein TEA_022583 [Camellia sinensis var. sinensis]
MESVVVPPSPMAGRDRKLHIVMFPWLAFGHMIPYLELAKFIAQKGHKISFVSTPRNIQRLPKLPPNLSPFIHFKAFDGLETGLAGFLQASTPDWIIYDFAPHWLPPIATKLGISRAFFLIFNALFAAFFGLASALIDCSDDIPMEPEQFTVPPKWVQFPTNVVFRLYESKRILASATNNASGVSDLYRYGSAVLGCDVFAIRHCTEFEPQWLTLLQDLQPKPLGLMPPAVVDHSGRLNNQNKGSVVYVALGSEVMLSQEEVTELAFGLELSGVPFFWALRKPPGWNKSKFVELSDGFEERTRSRGVVWKSWAPQLKILGHESVVGFLTHCGWSFVIKGLQFGKPLIMLPFMVDQGLNARVLHEKKVGIEIPRDEEDGSITRNSVADSIRLVMVDNNEGLIYRKKAKKMSALFGDKLVIPLGLMPPAVVDDNGVNETWLSISERLNNQNNGSVVYVALGSEAMPSQKEVIELALGLELSGLPYFWALRRSPGSNKSESVELPDGF